MSETAKKTIQTKIEQNDLTAVDGEALAKDANSGETTAEVSHETTLFAEPVFNLGSLTVTNSLLNAWVVVLILCGVALLLKKGLAKVPKRLQTFFEIVVNGALNLADSVTGSRAKSLQIFPIVFCVFVFVLLNNWLGLLPGIGSIGFIERAGSHAVFVPLFRGATADLNTTLALALMAVVGSNLFGVIAVGFWKYFNKFVNIRSLAAIPKKIGHDLAIVIINPIKFFVGLIEIIGEVAKVASLSFRLFGNVFAGEVLLAAMAAIFAFVLPVPFMFLEVIVGAVQAVIFAMLTLVYFTIAGAAEEH